MFYGWYIGCTPRYEVGAEYTKCDGRLLDFISGHAIDRFPFCDLTQLQLGTSRPILVAAMRLAIHLRHYLLISSVPRVR